MVAALAIILLYAVERFVHLQFLIKKLDQQHAGIIMSEKQITSRISLFLALFNHEDLFGSGFVSFRKKLHYTPKQINFSEILDLADKTVPVSEEAKELALSQEITGRIDLITFQFEEAEVIERQITSLAKNPIVLPYFLFRRKNFMNMLGFQGYVSREDI